MRHLRTPFILGTFIIIGFLIYSNTLKVPFYFDDFTNIKYNKYVRSTELSIENLSKAAFKSSSPTRPLSNISFLLNYYLFDGKIEWFHYINISIHIINAILLYVFILITLRIYSAFTSSQRQIIAFLASLIWLVHPIQTQSVTYIVQRMNSLAAMFYLISFLLYLKGRLGNGRSWPWFAGCAIAWLFSLGCKENVAFMPFLIFLYELYFFQNLNTKWLKRNLYLLLFPIITIVALCFIYVENNSILELFKGYSHRDFTPTQRVLTEFRVVLFYLSLLFFPHPSRLNLDHNFIYSRSLFDPITTLLSLGSLIGLVCLSVYLAKKERLISFCILWFLVNLVIESSIIPLELVFEHRSYLPSMLLFLIIPILAYKFLQRHRVILVTIGSIIILLSMGTYQRNSKWLDPTEFWKDCAYKSKEKLRPNYNLGNALLRESKFSEATSYFYKALELDPFHHWAHNNLGIALSAEGDMKEAILHYYEALKIDQNNVNAGRNLNMILLDLGKYCQTVEKISDDTQVFHITEETLDYYAGNYLMEQAKYEEASKHFFEILRNNPHFDDAHGQLGIIMAKQGRFDEAIDHFSEALSINPQNAKYHYYLALSFGQQDIFSEAINHFYKALHLSQGNGNQHISEVIHFLLGITLAGEGDLKEAIHHFSEAVQFNPDNMEAHYHLGTTLSKQGKLKEAVIHFTELLRIKPDSEEVHNELGITLAKLGRLEDAINHFSIAVTIDSEFSNAFINLQKAIEIRNRSIVGNI